MYVSYDDILSRVSTPPTWWGRGVPRFSPFSPGAASVYSSAELLLEGECSQCAARFVVCVCGGVPGLIDATGASIVDLSDDPPHHDDPGGSFCAGTSSTMLVSRVLEAWWRLPLKARNPDESDTVCHVGAWTRLPHLEGPFRHDWDDREP